MTRVNDGTWRWTVGLGLVLGLVAAWSMPREIQAGDAAEFATIMLGGGVPHPSGYPWMRVLGLGSRALAIGGVPPSLAAALPCSVSAIAGWLLVQRTGIELVRPHPRANALGSLAAALPALCHPVVLHSYDSEVWGPLTLFAGLFMHAAVVARRPPFVLGLLLGLAVTHHLTAVLLVPLAIASAWPGVRESPFPKPRRPTLRGAWLVAKAGLVGILGSAIGLSFFATLCLGTGGRWRWGDTSTWGGLVHHVTRADYGVLALSLHDTRPAASALLLRALTSVGTAVTGGLATSTTVATTVVAILLAMVLWAAIGHRRPRAVLGLWTSGVASTVLFPLAHNIDPMNPFGAWILERFDILSLALLSPPLAVVLSRLTPTTKWRYPWNVATAVAMAMLLAHQVLRTWARGVASDNPTVERYAIDLLRTPPPGQRAIVFGTDDHRTFPAIYAEEILGLGHDVLYVDASLLAHAWYRAWLRARVPALPDVDKPVRMMSEIRRLPAFDGTALYLANVFSRPSAQLATVPEGILLRVISPGEPTPSATEVASRHRAAFERYPARRATDRRRTADPFASDLLGIYADHERALLEWSEASTR